MTAGPDIPGQYNNGSGVFVAGANYGPINTVDDKTKALLEKLTEQAPDLGRLLSRALDDGVISQDIVHLLERAAWSINEDVAGMLSRASQNINHDVAASLRVAADSINPTTVMRLEEVVDRIDRAFGRVADVTFTDEMRRLEIMSSKLSKEAIRIERAVTPPPPQLTVRWNVTVWAFLSGILIGAMLAAWGYAH